MALAVAVTWAIPLDPMIAVAAERLAEAPFGAGSTEKSTTPPATCPGYRELFVVTVTASGLANASSESVPCGVLPVTTVRVNPWLWKAPMSVGVSKGAPR